MLVVDVEMLMVCVLFLFDLLLGWEVVVFLVFIVVEDGMGLFFWIGVLFVVVLVLVILMSGLLLFW